jgi:hypothetical protein
VVLQVQCSHLSQNWLPGKRKAKRKLKNQQEIPSSDLLILETQFPHQTQ